MTSVALKAHNYGFGVSLIFFACYQITIGVVIFKSGYIPKAVGVLMQMGGTGYLINNFALIVYPSITRWLFQCRQSRRCSGSCPCAYICCSRE